MCYCDKPNYNKVQIQPGNTCRPGVKGITLYEQQKSTDQLGESYRTVSHSLQI